MADNESMKTNIFILLVLITLTACNASDDGGTFTYKAPGGTINKVWLPVDSLGTVTSVDLSDPNNIIVLNVTHTKVIQKPSNGMPGKRVVTVSDCVYSSAQVVETKSFSGYFDTTLVSGNPIACNQLIPLYFRHYGFEENSNEFLMIGVGSFK